jgi:hypothetical protein
MFNASQFAMSKKLAIVASVLVLGTLAACGNSSDGDKEEKVVTPTYQKNAALSFTTLTPTTVGRTVTTPMPNLPTNMIRSTTAPTVRPTSTTTSIPKTVTTPVPKFPRR